ncbi:unnamed protein product [Blepharisma stoltei]|uniref:ERCC4 domain-containing protein n=1 Tax=Blepharisma stoltei TaxID=1481888 RepID=A0AAU9J5I8_9CILI|nr:unnamed protein product [Blepharisma stoltei]
MKQILYVDPSLSEIMNYIPEEGITTEITDRMYPFPTLILWVRETTSFNNLVWIIISPSSYQRFLSSSRIEEGFSDLKSSLDNSKISFIYQYSAREKQNWKENIQPQLQPLIAKWIFNFGFDLLEMENLNEISQYIIQASSVLVNSKTSDDLQMIQKQPERFHPHETWVKFLTAIPQMSLAKAQAIISKYPSLTSLLEAYEIAEASKRETLLMSLTAGSLPIGKALSIKIYTYLTSLDPFTIL